MLTQTCSQGRRSPRKESQRGLMDAHSQACSQGERFPRKESQRGLRDAHSQTCSQTRRDLKRKPQGFRGYKNWIHQIRPSHDLCQTRIDQKESHKASEDIETGSFTQKAIRSDLVVACSQTRSHSNLSW